MLNYYIADPRNEDLISLYQTADKSVNRRFEAWDDQFSIIGL